MVLATIALLGNKSAGITTAQGYTHKARHTPGTTHTQALVG